MDEKLTQEEIEYLIEHKYAFNNERIILINTIEFLQNKLKEYEESWFELKLKNKDNIMNYLKTINRNLDEIDYKNKIIQVYNNHMKKTCPGSYDEHSGCESKCATCDLYSEWAEKEVKNNEIK